MSHAIADYPYADAVKVREPVARPLDVVAVELLLTAAQAFLVGVLMYMAVGFWQDQGVGLGSVSVVLMLMALALGGSWLYWLLGGVGWPMAASNAPVALLFGFTLVMSWFGDDLFRVSGAPLLLAAFAAVFGIVSGVFLDSPRRWRWDQREKLRPGTQVPRVSPTTQALATSVPRTLPRRSRAEETVSDLASRIGSSTPPSPASSGEVSTATAGEEVAGPTASETAVSASGDSGAPSMAVGPTDDASLTEAPAVEGSRLEVPVAPEPMLPTDRLSRAPHDRASTSDMDDEDDGIVLPTMVEPRAQRSPWAWAAPPEWNRDEEDDVQGTSKRR